MAIYKYVSEQRIDILQNSLIRFTQPSKFNDPFETYPFFKSLTDHKSIKQLTNNLHLDEDDILKRIEIMFEEQYREATQKFHAQLPPLDYLKQKFLDKAKLRVHIKELIPTYDQLAKNMFESILKLDTKESRQFVLPIMLDSINKTIGILSLTEKRDNLLMWAHYSNNHQGFVIEFDEKHKFFDQRTKPNELRRHFKKVIYSKQRPEIVLYNSEISEEENLNNMINNIFWNKSYHWEYEQEWRMIYTLEGFEKKLVTDNDEIYLFSLPLDCVKGIILGCKMLEENKRNVINLLKSDDKYSHIKLYQAEIDEKEYKLNITEITI